MSPHDLDLEDALRATFRAHEYLADRPGPSWKPQPARPRSHRYIVVAVAASAVLAANVWMGYRTDGGPAQRPGTPVTIGAADPHIGVTRRWVSATLARISVPPGTQRRDRAPAAELSWDQPPSADGGTLTATGWFLAPGSVEQTTTYFLTHSPAGLSRDGGRGSGISSYRDGRVVHHLTFNDSQELSAAYTGAHVTISLFGTSAGVAMRIDAEATWLATRGPNTQVPLPVVSVDLVHERGAKHLATRTVTGRDAEDLANLVNATRAADPRPRSCPAQTAPADWLRLVFHSSTHTTTVVIRRGDCHAVAQVEINGLTQSPALEAAQPLTTAVGRLLPGRAWRRAALANAARPEAPRDPQMA